MDEELHHREQARYAEVHRKAWETDIVEKRRLTRMWEDKEVFASQIMQRRTADFAQLKVWWWWVEVVVVFHFLRNVVVRASSMCVAHVCMYNSCSCVDPPPPHPPHKGGA